ncbi:MAG: FtsX-like permease family protein [Candidatus Sericytochromatia bacterium]
MNNYIFKIYKQIFKRDKEKLILSFLSLFIGAFVISVILGLVSSVKNYVNNQSKELIGGDIVLQQSFPIDYKNYKHIKEAKNIEISEKIQTIVSTANIKNEFISLGSIRVIENNYPLYGNLDTQNNSGNFPKENEVFAEKTFFEKTNLKIGDFIFIGKGKFLLKDMIINEPDKFGSDFSFAPKILMNLKSFEKTQIDKSVSRISYYVMIKDKQKFFTKEKLEELEKDFKIQGVRVTTALKGPTQLVNIIEAWERFFITISVLTMFLIMVNIRVNLIYIINYFTKTIAVFRTLGMSKNAIIKIFSLLLFTISLSAGVVGNIIGNLAIYGILPNIEKILSVNLPLPSIIDSFFIAVPLTVILCFLASIQAFNKILEIEPKIILSQPINAIIRKKSILNEIITSLIIAFGLFIGIYYLTENLFSALISVTTVSILFTVFILLVKFLISTLYKNRYKFNFSARSIINFVKNQGLIGETAIASLTLALSGIFLISLIQTNIEGNLQGPLKNKIPNLYIIDIQEDQVIDIKKYFKNINLFPNVRGRFMKLDDKNLQTSNEKLDPELTREFNLTYRSDLIKGEKLYSGEWHGNNQKMSVSVEKRFAERAKIKLGSKVEFMILGIPISAKVTSIRTVDSSQGLPFFFFVFSPDVLQDAPRAYFAYTNIDNKKLPQIQTDLIRKFPNLFLIPTGEVIKTIQSITDLILFSVTIVSFPALILGMILICSMLVSSAQERFKELLLFKVFGSEQKQIFNLYLYESTFFIIFSAIFATIFSLALTFILNKYFFNFDNFYLNYQILFMVFAILVFSVLFTIYLIKKMFVKTPSMLFREQ